MKKRLSVFWSTILITLPLVLLADIIVLLAAYNYVSDTTYQHFTEDLKSAADVAFDILGNDDLHSQGLAEYDSEQLSRLCEELDVPYIYVLEIDVTENTQQYLAIGVSSKASLSFIENRHIGDVVKDDLSPQEISALKGDTENNVEHLTNNMDDTLIYYIPRTVENANNEIIGAEISVVEIMADLDRDFNYIALTNILFSVAVVLAFALIINRKISRPAKTISKKMSRFVRDHEKGFEKLTVKGSKEFTEMADAFNAMAGEIDRYLDELSELNRQKAELNIARDIQIGLLEPTEFQSDTAYIRACMLPAKDVGGDLYDYQVLPDGKICVIIADVSGKGVAAALFMSRAITLLHQYVEAGMSPGKILYEYNNHLAARNPNMLFITTFVGIYDAGMETLVYANAGHNDPYLISDKLIKLDGERGMAAGIFADERYEEHTVSMRAGDLLFLYTDGVTEAQNSRGEFFTEEALEDELSRMVSLSKDDVVAAVLKRIKEFSDGAEQADDITMLTLLSRSPFHCKLHLKAKEENLTAISNIVSQLDVPDDIEFQLNLMAEEIFVNICSYAFPDIEGEVTVVIDRYSDRVAMTFIDSGEPFDSTENILQIDDYDIDNAVGGLGRFLTFSYANEYSYERDGEKNILTVIKHI